MLIYVAGPYSAASEEERIANTEQAMLAAWRILGRGHHAFIPHLTHFFDVYVERMAGERLAGETYMQWDFAILRRCDALLYLAPSPGADRELALARELSLPVYLSVDEIPAVGVPA